MDRTRNFGIGNSLYINRFLHKIRVHSQFSINKARRYNSSKIGSDIKNQA